jgi:hypothetical protein
VTSEDDALYSRPDETHLVKESQIFLDVAIGVGDDHPERTHPEKAECIGMSG